MWFQRDSNLTGVEGRPSGRANSALRDANGADLFFERGESVAASQDAPSG
jgi:hypothetical protein